MTIEAGIKGPILDEATKGIQKRQGVEQGRKQVPGIHAMVNDLLDNNVKTDESGRVVHNGRGWSKITVYLNPNNEGVSTHVNLVRHIRSREVFVHIDGLDSNIHVGSDRIELSTIGTVPQKAMSSYESMRIPTGSSIPGAPPYETREATLEEVEHIDDFVGMLYDPACVERIGNNQS